MFTNHDPENGRTLYGAEIMVHPACQGLGVGSRLYEARESLVRERGLLRIRAGARLRDYARYADSEPPIVERDRINAIVTGALLATRPGPDGRFAVPDFETLHRNLAAAYPASAKAANAFLQEISA